VLAPDVDFRMLELSTSESSMLSLGDKYGFWLSELFGVSFAGVDICLLVAFEDSLEGVDAEFVMCLLWCG
jgi:hypothetical protein